MRVPSSTPAGMFTASDFSFCTRPAPRQTGQGSAITWPAPWQVGQVRSTVKKPCCARTLPAPPHVPPRGGPRARAGTGAVAGLAAHRAGNADRRLLAGEGVLQRYLHVVAEIGAAPGLPPAAPPRPAAHELAEQVVEHVGEAGAEVEAGGAGAAARAIEGGVTEAVVGRALLLVGEHVVGLGNLLELLLGDLVIRIAVRMVLHRELAIGLLEVVLAGIAGGAEKVVVVGPGHGSAPREGVAHGRPVADRLRIHGSRPRPAQEEGRSFLSSTSSKSASTTVSRSPPPGPASGPACGSSIGPAPAVAGLPGRVHGLAELHRALAQQLHLGLDGVRVLAAERLAPGPRSAPRSRPCSPGLSCRRARQGSSRSNGSAPRHGCGSRPARAAACPPPHGIRRR